MSQLSIHKGNKVINYRGDLSAPGGKETGMKRIPPLQLSREMAEFVMAMNANNMTFSIETLDELAALHRKMKLETENTREPNLESFDECFTARELVGVEF